MSAEFFLRTAPAGAEAGPIDTLTLCTGSGEALFTLSSPFLRGKTGDPLPLSVKTDPAASGNETASLLSLRLAGTDHTGTDCAGTVRLFSEDSTALLALSLDLPDGMEQAAFPIAFPDRVKEIFASSLTSPWWMTTAFPTHETGGLAGVDGRVQACFFKAGDRHGMLLCLPGERFRCHIEKGILSVSAGSPCGGKEELRTEGTDPSREDSRKDARRLSGSFLSLTLADSPFAAAKEGFETLRKLGVLPVPLRRERVYPDKLRGLGFCSWNAFYQNVTAEGLYAKMEEFKAARIPVDFVVIDDGWSLLRDGKLASFGADPVKFPGGLAPCVRRLKEEYGVRFVGVWHAIQGYWGGVSPEGALYEQEKENLAFTKGGSCIPAPEEEKAFAFYDHFYTSLAAEGVDFVKVDVQSGLVMGLDGIAPPSAGLREIHRGLERAAARHFDGVIINCMGMDLESGFARPFTAVNRNSDDFFVNDPKRGFVSHAMANIYNAMTDGEIYYTDFDMWWSVHPEGKRSALLRALSGGPQYVSDRLRDEEKGESGSDASLILPLLGEDGMALMPFHAGRPTLDCVYTDPRQEGVMKVWNEGPLGFAVAAFNCAGETRRGTLRLEDLPGTAGSYAVVDYFTGEVTVLTGDGALEFTLPAGAEQAKLWNLYPLREDGSALLGDPSKYLGVCTPVEKARLWRSR